LIVAASAEQPDGVVLKLLSFGRDRPRGLPQPALLSIDDLAPVPSDQAVGCGTPASSATGLPAVAREHTSSPEPRSPTAQKFAPDPAVCGRFASDQRADLHDVEQAAKSSKGAALGLPAGRIAEEEGQPRLVVLDSRGRRGLDAPREQTTLAERKPPSAATLEGRRPEPGGHAAPDRCGPSGTDYGPEQTLVPAMDMAVGRDETGEDGGEAGSAAAGAITMSPFWQDYLTRAKYLTRGRQLLSRYKRERGVWPADEDVDPRDFAGWLISLRPCLAASSWRQYRLSASAFIEGLPHEGLEEALAILAGTGHMEEEARVVYRQTREKEGPKTSAGRAKRMEYQHYCKIRTFMRQISRSAAVEWLDDWLVAGISTGLRPGEWSLAQLEVRRLPHGQRKIWLHVVNAKATNGRGNGTFRTLDISDFCDETLEAIERMVKRSEEWAKAGKTVARQSDCAQLFSKVCNVLFPRMQKKYSLYSLRHQFIANMKSIFDLAEVATLSGHLSVKTQITHYGKRRSAWLRSCITDVPKPIKEQVDPVRKYCSLMEERERLRSMHKAGRGVPENLGDDASWDPPGEDMETPRVEEIPLIEESGRLSQTSGH